MKRLIKQYLNSYQRLLTMLPLFQKKKLEFQIRALKLYVYIHARRDPKVERANK